MSEVIDAETKSYDKAMSQLLALVILHAERARIKKLTEEAPRSAIYFASLDADLGLQIRDLKKGYCLAYVYNRAALPELLLKNRQLLKYSIAWILHYDSQHARWSVEAWNDTIGNRAFDKLARRLRYDPSFALARSG